MAVISNGTTIIDAGAVSVGTGSMTLIKTLTASSSANLSFVHGASSVVLDDTYDSYVFKFINIHNSEESIFQVNFRDGGSAYDATKTTSYFYAYAAENDGEAALIYSAADDLAQSTDPQRLARSYGIENDECISGELTLFNPSSTTFVKHFISRGNYVDVSGSPLSLGFHIGGYCNVTAAIDGVQFSCASGNIDSGIIKLYGIGG